VSGTVEQIAISAATSVLPDVVEEVEVGAEGVVGDRHRDAGDVTLIEA
jgi:hypothetical protein